MAVPSIPVSRFRAANFRFRPERGGGGRPPVPPRGDIRGKQGPMQNALGLMGDQAIMVGITLALGIGGVLALFMALFWPARWHLPYRMEVAFVVLLAGLAVYADANSAGTYQAYEADLPGEGALSGALAFDAAAAGFDRHIKVYAFQWGFLFFDEDGAASRNAVNHGFQRITVWYPPSDRSRARRRPV